MNDEANMEEGNLAIAVEAVKKLLDAGLDEDEIRTLIDEAIDVELEDRDPDDQDQ
jgi:cytochrome c-type biogenesis protein CcmH/NrfG